MNKTAIKNFSIWARNKLISDIQFRAQLLGVLPDGIREPLPQSEKETQFFDIGTKDYVVVKGNDVYRREAFVAALRAKTRKTDYGTAYKSVIEKIAYTWFNRLIAIRFMEVNDYLPGQVRVLSSHMAGKAEPDIVSTPFDSDLEFSAQEQDVIMRLKDDNKLDDLFRMLFISQCHKLSEILPGLFAPKENSIPPREFYELLLSISFTDRDGLVWHLVHDIPERDFRVRTREDDLRQAAEGISEDEMPAGQVEIIGWLYQYYNTEPNAEVYDGTLSKAKIPKEMIPAATTIYTPDWPIRYMVQNSLGRLWVEGHPDTKERFMPEHNADGSVCVREGRWNYYLEEAPQEPQVEAQLAAIREEYASLRPEDIQVIDPCCGSGHIAVYLFDVLMQIYESQGWTQREAAQSIVEHNLYALDIDDRAVQLAYFAVTMKARQYDRRFFTRGLQPRVYAIPEWDEETRKGWSVELKNLCNLLRDGKEFGSIIDLPEMDWNTLHMEVECMANMQGQISFDSVSEITRQKLRGLIEVGQTMSQKYDVVVTNPPYLGSSRFNEKLAKQIKENYPDVRADLSMVMFKHAIDAMVKQNGIVSFITTNSWMFLSSFEKLRDYVSAKMTLTSLVDFGTELFDGKVGHNAIVAWCVCNANVPEYTVSAIRLVDYCYSRREEKEMEYFDYRNRYRTKQSLFTSIPGKPIAYWASKPAREAFASKDTIGSIAPPKQGLATADNDRFLRLWVELDIKRIAFGISCCEEAKRSGMKWFPYNKGGSFRRWYGNRDYVVNWANDGYEIKHFTDDKGKVRSRPQNLSFYFRPCITWSDVTSGAFSGRYCEQGFMFDIKGSSGFPQEDMLLYVLGLLNSKISQGFIKMLNPTITTQVGDMARVPVIISNGRMAEINTIVSGTIAISRADWDAFETSWDFQVHPLIRCAAFSMEEMRKGALNHIRDVNYIEEAFVRWSNECYLHFQQLKANEEALNRIFIEIYGLQDELTPEVEDKDVTVRRADLGRDIRSLISYAVGCMFGRYSLNKPGLAYAGGKWEDVFGTLREPWETGAGDIITTNAGEPIEFRVKNGTIKHNGQEIKLDYRPDDDNCIPITDEPYFEDDIVGRFVEFIRVAYGDATLEANLDFIAHALGNKGDTSRDVIRNYFLNDFFKDHCSTYSVTGSGKRPIYWLFDSGKANGFKALVYMHRWTADTVGNLRVEYLHRMQRVYEKEIERMQDTIDNARDSREVARATKRREKLVKQLKEASDYDTKIAHVALSRVEIDLDDGVKVNYEKVQKGPDGKSLGILAKI